MQHPLIAAGLSVGIIFAFLIVRNSQLFDVPDVFEGAIVRLQIVDFGFTVDGFAEYADMYVVHPYNNAFQPIWFLVFYGLTYISTSPLFWGAVSFVVAASMLFLLYKVVLHFCSYLRYGKLYALFCMLLFSSTIFFLEMIAWKWMLALTLSSLTFLACLYLTLRREQPGLFLRIIFGLSLLCCMWTFGTGWVMALGLSLFLLLKKYVVRDGPVPYLPIALCLTAVGVTTAFFANAGTVGGVNIPFVVMHAVAMSTMVAVNSVVSFIGAFRFTDISGELMGVATVLGAVVIALTGYYFYNRLRTKKFNEKDALCLTLLIAYLILVSLSLVRLMPPTGLEPTSEFDNYIFGGRYVFAFSLPLFIVLAIALAKLPGRLHLGQIAICIVGALALGVAIQLVFARTDPFMTNPNRLAFYNATLPAIREASNRGITLPNISSDLLFRDLSLPLQHAVRIRKESIKYPLSFKSPEKMTPDQCYQVRTSKVISDWLDTYSQNWCPVK